MAAVNLSASANSPWVYTVASVGTTWQEFILPSWCRVVSVVPSGNAYATFKTSGAPASVTTATDGGAVGTHRVPISTSGFSFALDSGIPGDPTHPAQTRVFCAAASGTVDITLVLG